MALVDFVMRLGSDARLLRQFESDPDAAMKDAGLSNEETFISKDRNPDRIADAISPGPRLGGVVTVEAVGIET